VHPSICFKGLINGEIFRYWVQKNPHNFTILLPKFIKRLVAHGHSIEQLTPLLLQAAANLEFEHKNNFNTDDSKTLFIHWTYHPKGLQTKDLWAIYNETLQPHITYNSSFMP
jgi:hypothetical protein